MTTPGRPTLDEVVHDLVEEQADLEALVARRSEPDWDTSTPAEGWSVRDTISHLAFFDEAATRAMLDPEGFRAGLAQVVADPAGYMDAAVAAGRDVTAHEVLTWWQRARCALVAAFGAADPADRFPWYGPDMGAVSFATARLMETWAHGQDVADAFGVRRTATPRLRHVAHLGVSTRAFSFLSAGREVPAGDVRVELTAPDGSRWTWGPAEAADRVTGSALGFCLLVTQRRHRADTDVDATGPGAVEWLTIAQAFAGPSGGGRAPGLPAY